MRLLALCALAVVLAGCCGTPTMTLRNPLLFDTEPNTVAGQRLVQAPMYMAPTYTPVQAPQMYAAPLMSSPCLPAAPRAAPCP